ncbi:hypothetical protein AB0F81_14050 [Actinoplanes sp. NPDC024001]|uniref:hypothetical protein n=1 Tax=Actinoplanes sp. NPDC024001 TaxID=3154598 RepID=UPI0033DFD163
MSELERSYRRLLLAYPAFYRRERGLEMLTTLLDAAEPGQVRPSYGEAAHLLVMGLRFRFVPPTWIGKVAAGLVTIWAAVVLSGAGALAVWAVDDPQTPELATLSDSLAGRQPTFAYDDEAASLLDMGYAHQTAGNFQSYAEEGWEGVLPAPMGRHRIYERVPAAPAVLAEARERLTGAGWQTGPLSRGGINSQAGPDGPNGVLWAHRDGMLLRVSAYDDQTGLTVSAYPVEPAGVLAAALAAFAVGGIAVWQAMTWLAHRAARTPPPTRRLVLLLGLPALIACGVNTLDNVLSMVPNPHTAGVLLAADFMYPLGNQIANPLAAGVIASSLIACGYLVNRAGRLAVA